MKNIFKKTAAIVSAVAFLVTSLAACTPSSPPAQEGGGYSVVFNYNDGISRPRTYYTQEGGSIDEPAEPEREGYSLSGWFTSQEGGEEISFPYTPTGDVTIYARWTAEQYDVTFDFNIEGSNPYVQRVDYDSTVSAPADDVFPENPGYSFYRWEDAPQDGDPITFPYTVRRDTTFYASWLSDEVSIYTVTFDSNFEGGEQFEPMQVVQGESITERQAPEPERAGHEFAGWATTPDADEPDVEFPYSPTANVTLYAVWEQQTYLVRFRYNYTGAPGGLAQAFEEVRIAGGQTVEQPETDPVREGFEFIGWYDANAGGDLVTFPYTVTRTTTFYAGWRANAITPTENRFDAEFTPISPTYHSPTYSGNATGTQIITEDDGTMNARSEQYPLLDDNHRQHSSYYVGALYVYGASLTFTIYSSERVTGVSLYASLAVEINQNVVISREGQFGFEFIVNGTSIDYGSIDLTRPNVTPGTQHHSAFDEYLVANNITLNEGENTIVLRVNNNYETASMRAMAPLVDYIRLGTTATLTWHPEYDNLYRQV